MLSRWNDTLGRFVAVRGCEKMGLAPSRNGENPGKSAVAKVPVPIFSPLLSALLILAAGAAASAADLPRETVSVVKDDFEQGRFHADWDATAGDQVRVVPSPGEGAGGSNGYARVEGVAVGQGGLGASLAYLFRDSFATDFSIALDFRTEETDKRRFGLIVVATSAAPVAGQATINLRYEAGGWSVFTDRWNSLAELGSIAPGTWNRLVLRGNRWGTGIESTATYDLEVTDHEGTVRQMSGLQFYQGDPAAPDRHGARSFSLNDAFGENPGFDVDNVVVTATGRAGRLIPKDPVAFSGIYPHLAVSNGTNSESGIGAVMDWSGKLWYTSYPAHLTTGSPDKLYSVDSDLSQRIHPRYPGSTNANRYLDTTRQRMFIGSAIVDAQDSVRVLPVARDGDLRGRLTGTGPHLSDADKVYYMTMEEGFYTVDLSDPDAPEITTLRADGNHGGSRNLPGAHGKGFYVAQGHVFFSNNGTGGGLVEWDGQGDPAEAESWTVVDTNKYNEITTRHGVAGDDPNATVPVWALGWDHRSVLLNVRDAATGTWMRFRLPKGSYTHDHEPGHFVEWPRIRDVGLGGEELAMNEHGLLFRFPAGFSTADTAGIVPVATFHKMIVDYVQWGGRIVVACNDATPFANPLCIRSHSNLMFVEKAGFDEYGGRPFGFGGPWVRDAVEAGQPSEPFLITGFAHRTVHLAHTETMPVRFTIEIDATGKGRWDEHAVVAVDASGYGYAELPTDLPAVWLRLKTDRDVASATAYLHLSNPQRLADPSLIGSLARLDRPSRQSRGLLLTEDSPAFPLQFAAETIDQEGQVAERAFYRVQLDDDLKLQIVPVDDPQAEADVRERAATSQDFGVDDASVYIDRGGVRYRLPRGDAAFDSPTSSGWRRGIREVVTERAVMNIHGTFYEVPRDSSGGMRRIRPITTHDLDIFDYASWRGMLVLSGNLTGAAEDSHYVASADGQVGLWFGNIDDLWRFGSPRGRGGPWLNTAVKSGAPSDPYLMFGYDRKRLTLAHAGTSDVGFRIEVDLLGDNHWHEYKRVNVPAGETVRYDFPPGYSAHWVRLTADQNVVASAQFDYTPGSSGE